MHEIWIEQCDANAEIEELEEEGELIRELMTAAELAAAKGQLDCPEPKQQPPTFARGIAPSGLCPVAPPCRRRGCRLPSPARP